MVDRALHLAGLEADKDPQMAESERASRELRRDLVVFHGSSTVDSTVNGSLTAFDAPVTISAE